MWVRIYNPVKYLRAAWEGGGKALSVVFFQAFRTLQEEEEGRSIVAESREYKRRLGRRLKSSGGGKAACVRREDKLRGEHLGTVSTWLRATLTPPALMRA